MKIVTILMLLLLLPWVSPAQQQNPEEPFKRDPIFTKSLEELFGTETAEEEPGKASEHANAVKRLSNRGIDLSGGFEAGPYFSNPLYNQYPNLSAFHFNRVNGLFIGIKRERMQWHRSHNFLGIPRFQPHGFIGYGTASKEFEYGVGLERFFGYHKKVIIGAEYHKSTATEDYWRTGLIENSLTSAMAGYDYHDYYKMEGFGAYTVIRSNRWIEAAVSYNSDTFTSANLNTRYSVFGYASTYRPNPPVDDFSDEIGLNRYNLSFSLNPRRLLMADRFAFSAFAGAELADNAGSDENYRYNKIWSELQLFYNFEPGSVLKWRLKTGTVTGNVPGFKQFYIGGIGSLRGSPYKIFSGNDMILSNLEVQFGSPTNRNNSWYEQYNVHLLFFLDSGWVNSDENFTVADVQHDAGVGIGTDALRVEVAWPLKTFESTPAIWLRLNPAF